MGKSKKFGLEAILNLYSKNLLYKGAKLPFYFTIFIVLIYYFFGDVTPPIIETIVDMSLSIIPNLLGFVLSGYALLIGFGNIKLIATKLDAKSNIPTLYQRLSSIFAVGLIFQVLLIVFAIVLKFLLKLNLQCECEIYLICELINYFLFTSLIFCILYVTFMIIDIIINIFNFSQVQHLDINKQRD